MVLDLDPRFPILNPRSSTLNPKSYSAAAHTLAHSWAPLSNLPRQVPEASQTSLPTNHLKSKILNKGRSFDVDSQSPVNPHHQGPRSKERYFDPDDFKSRWKKLSSPGSGAGEGGGEGDGGFDHRRQVAGSSHGSGAFGGDTRPFDVTGQISNNESLTAIGNDGEAVKIGKVEVEAGDFCGFDHSKLPAI